MRSLFKTLALSTAAVLAAGPLLLGSEPPPGPELAQLVQRLGSPRFAEREQATQAIRDIGAEALDLLKQARESHDPEVRARALRLLESIEREAALSPTLVRLPEAPADVESIINQLDEQTDFLIRTTSSGLLSPPAPIQAGERVPFWQAVELLGLEPSWSSIDSFRMLELPVERPHLRLALPSETPASAWHDGPFRVSARQGRSLLEERFNQPADTDHVTLDLSVDVEPKLTILGRPQITLSEAIDPDGHPLLMDGLTHFSPGSDDALELTSLHVQATLNRENPRARSIARLRGTVEMDVEAATSEPVEIPLDDALAIRTIELDGLRLTVMDVRQMPLSRSVTLDLHLEPADWSDMFQNQGFRRRRFDMLNIPRIRVLERLSLLDSHGNPVPHVRNRGMRLSPSGFQVSLYSSPSIDDPLPEKLVIRNTLRLPVRLDFSLENIPLKPASR